MRINVLVLVLFLFFNTVSGMGHNRMPYQGNLIHPGDTVDKRLFDHAKNAPANVSQDIDDLVEYLRLPAANKRDMVKVFSYWIMQNISYDIYGFMNGNFNTEGVAGTLREKKGVCQDYSELFKAMCDRAGIKCYVIPGYAKAFDYIPGNKFNKANHAWNLVGLDNDYLLMDLTWCSGHVQYIDNTWRYFISPDTSQIFVDPAVFIEKHLPADPRWQLLEHPVSMNAFMNYSDHNDMLKGASRYYNYKDSINLFEKLGKEEQELKTADAAYSFYPAITDYAYHYYNLAVNYSNTATDYYNAAVSSYNKSVSENGNAIATGDYNKTGVSNAINNYSKAIKLLMKIRNYADNDINAGQLLEKCTEGLDASNEMLRTLR